MTCASCGAAANPGSRFCPGCGQPLELRADERRIVTVLFADLIGFTGFSERRDPEHVKNVVDRCFELLAADITAFGGRVDKIMGDGLIAMFGAPIAHEDDAERAVRAALQMQQTLSSSQSGLDVRMRVGINTGQVLVGSLRAASDYTAMGDVVNVASRLQTLAEAGQVIVGPDTFTATNEVIRYEPLGMVQARGREEPIESWIALEALALPGRRPRRAVAPLVGRSHEMGTLTSALGNTVVRRRPQLMLLLGEAGVGKSRLAAELASEAAVTHGALVLEGRCVPYGEANIWWPVAEAIRSACEIEPADSVAEMRQRCGDAVTALGTGTSDDAVEADRLTSGLLYLLGDDEALAELEPARAQEEALDAVEILLERLGRERPVLLLLSELHWADTQVLSAIDSILNRVRAIPLLVVATARNDLLERWSPQPGRHNITVLHVDALDRTAAAEMLATITESGISRELSEALIDRSGGNPFFLEEMVSLLAGSGPLPNNLQGAGAHELPATLRGLVAARLDALGRSDRDVLEDAAVFGRNGSVSALAAVRERSIDSELDSLAAADLLAVEESEWSFRSDLIREVAYATLAKAERARRHAAIASWMESRHQELGRDDDLELLAHHAGSAAELVQEMGEIPGVHVAIKMTALHAIEKAAVRAKHRDHHQSALRMLNQAQRLLSPDDKVNLQRLLLARAHSLAVSRDTAAARADIDAVLAIAEPADDRPTIASALAILGHAEQNEGAFDSSVGTLERAAALFRDIGDLSGEANALRLLSMTRLFGGSADLAIEPITRSLEAFRTVGDKRGQGWALQNLAWIAFSSMDLEAAEGHIDEALSLFDSIKDRGGESYALGLLGWVRLTEGKLEEASAIADRLLTHASLDTGDQWARAMTLSLRANSRLWLGDPAAAIEPASEALHAFLTVGDAMGQAHAHTILARALLTSGRVEEGLTEMKAGMAVTPDGTYMRPLVNGLPAAIAVQIGDVEAALAALPELSERGDSLFQLNDVLQAGVDIQRGNGRRAAEALGQLIEGTDNLGTIANALALKALAHSSSGEPMEAIEAADRVQAMETGTYLDRIQADTGRGFALAQLGRADEAEKVLRATVDWADRTTDLVAQALTRLSHSTLVGPGPNIEAESRLERLGIRADGWRRVFADAASHIPASV